MRDPQRGLRLVPTFFAMSISSRRPYSGTASSISEGPSQLGGSGTALARHAASAAVVDQYFLHVEAKLHHVPVAHHVLLALHAYLTARLGLRHGPSVHQLVEGDDLGLDEAAFEVGVDDAGGLRGGGARGGGPGAGR